MWEETPLNLDQRHIVNYSAFERVRMSRTHSGGGGGGGGRGKDGEPTTCTTSDGDGDGLYTADDDGQFGIVPPPSAEGRCAACYKSNKNVIDIFDVIANYMQLVHFSKHCIPF